MFDRVILIEYPGQKKSVITPLFSGADNGFCVACINGVLRPLSTPFRRKEKNSDDNNKENNIDNGDATDHDNSKKLKFRI